MDAKVRTLERQALAGDPAASLEWEVWRGRGDPDGERLARALRSRKAAQVEAALAEVGQDPARGPSLLPELFCATQDTKLGKARTKAKAVFAAHAPRALQDAIARVLKRSLFTAGEGKVADRLQEVVAAAPDAWDVPRLLRILVEDHHRGSLWAFRRGIPSELQWVIAQRVDGTELDLVNLELEEVPDLSLFPQLTRLDLMSNRLREFPLELAELGELVDLELGGNHLSALPDDLSAFRTLRRLSLQVCRFGTFPQGVLSLPALEELDLSTETFNPITVRAIPPEISRAKGLRVLRVGGGQGPTKVPDEIGELPRLEELAVRWESPAEKRRVAGLVAQGCKLSTL